MGQDRIQKDPSIQVTPVVAHEDDLRPVSLVIGIGTHNPTLTTQIQRNRQHEVRTLKEREKLQNREREIERGQEKREAKPISNWKGEHSIEEQNTIWNPPQITTPES